jgi:Xaa-Pro aminopeptidase
VEISSTEAARLEVPFDQQRLDGLLEEARLDVIVATSPHNVRYLLGGYAYFMYAAADSIGLSRYLPAVAYRRAAPEETMYVGAGNEAWATDVFPVWAPDVRNSSWGSQQTAEQLVGWCLARVGTGGRVGVELPYLPADAYRTLVAAGLLLEDGTELLEALRAIKRPDELELVRRGAGAVVDAMLATFSSTRSGDSKRDVFERLRAEETGRGLTFCYALIAAGTDMNRAPSAQVLTAGDVLSLDSGATWNGWVADVARMGIAGAPTPRHDELLDQVERVQEAAIRSARPGTRGGGLFDSARAAIVACDDGEGMSFLAHGTGLLTHEAPRLTATGSPPYPAAHADAPLEVGMVLSIESQVSDPQYGFIKVEDTVIVQDGPPELVAGHGRGWNGLSG